MGFWDDLKNSVGNAVSGAQNALSRYKNGDTMNGIMATLALVAAADGTIAESEEKEVVEAITASTDLVTAFGVPAMVNAFTGYCDEIRKSKNFGPIKVLGVVGKLKSNPEQATMAVQYGIVIAGADGNFDDKEKEMMRKIITQVGLKHADFGL